MPCNSTRHRQHYPPYACVIDKPARHRCHCAHPCHAHSKAVTPPRPRTGAVIAIRPDLEVKLANNFFHTPQHSGEVYKLNTVCQRGERISFKWVKPSHSCHFQRHVPYLQKAADITTRLVKEFANRTDMRGWAIHVVKPVMLSGCREMAIEPYVSNVKKFTSGTFREFDDSMTYKKLIIALAHYSFVASQGRYVLADLQGGVDESRCVVTLLPPTIISAGMGNYGCKDLGILHRFFCIHSCNRFCNGLPTLHHCRNNHIQSGYRCRGSGGKAIKIITK